VARDWRVLSCHYKQKMSCEIPLVLSGGATEPEGLTGGAKRVKGSPKKCPTGFHRSQSAKHRGACVRRVSQARSGGRCPKGLHRSRVSPRRCVGTMYTKGPSRYDVTPKRRSRSAAKRSRSASAKAMTVTKVPSAGRASIRLGTVKALSASPKSVCSGQKGPKHARALTGPSLQAFKNLAESKGVRSLDRAEALMRYCTADNAKASKAQIAAILNVSEADVVSLKGAYTALQRNM
jgi:hypothetical protein